MTMLTARHCGQKLRRERHRKGGKVCFLERLAKPVLDTMSLRDLQAYEAQLAAART